MLYKIRFVVSLLLLFTPVAHAATQAKNDSVTHKSASGEDSSAMANGQLLALLPLDHTSPIAGHTLEFSWTMIAAATQYRLEIEEAYGDATVKMARISSVGSYRISPSHLHSSKDLHWRVVALDSSGNERAETAWRILLSPSSECEK